ncbi:MAG TPA: TIGR03936 family radical SAM-associated protein [Clostridia bacterium]|nr:TIGR03936 family radical SAM-associated protein [Clostridia bacterium]
MLVLKYEKTGAMRFISHIDILRHFVRILRRANINVEFSKGFNPHMLIYFSPPLSLGVGSVAEYVTVETIGITADEFIKRYNDAAPKGLQASAVFEVAKDPKLQGVVCCADYVLPFSFDGIKIDNDYTITYDKQGEQKTEVVGDKIYGVWVKDNKTIVRLASGNINLRADRVATQFANDFNKEVVISDIVKTAQFIKVGNELVEADEYIRGKNEKVDGQDEKIID